MCSHQNSLDIKEDSVVSYDMLDNNKFKTIVIFDCRGLEPVDFDPRDGWKSQGYKGQLMSKGNFGVFKFTKKPTKFKGFLS